jgi:hypothetical protein
VYKHRYIYGHVFIGKKEEERVIESDIHICISIYLRYFCLVVHYIYVKIRFRVRVYLLSLHFIIFIGKKEEEERVIESIYLYMYICIRLYLH